MVLVAQCLGLRVSEILGLQWGDFNFEDGSVLVQRSVVGGRVDDVKTEYSKDDVPFGTLHWPRRCSVWRSASIFPRDEGGDFANPATGKPYHQEGLQKKQHQARGEARWVEERDGVARLPVSTYRSWLDETGALR